MSKHTVARVDPAPLSPNRFSQNGRTVNPTGWRSAAEAINQAAVHRKKCHFTFSYRLFGTNSPIPSGSTVSNLQALIRTGKNVARIKAIIGAMPSSSGNNLASCYLAFTSSSGASTTSTEMKCTNLDTSGGINYGIQFGTVVYDAPDENALYRIGVALTNSARILSVAIFEESDIAADTTSDVCVNPNAFQVFANQYDSDIGKVLTAGTDLWKTCAPPLIAWSRNSQATAPTFSSTSYYNILSPAVTVVSVNTPGFYLDTRYLSTRSRSTVPCLLLVHATRLTGTGSLYIQLHDGTNTVTSGAITSPLPNPCYSEAIAIPVQASTKWDVRAAVSSGSWRVEAVSLLQYEA